MPHEDHLPMKLLILFTYMYAYTSSSRLWKRDCWNRSFDSLLMIGYTSAPRYRTLHTSCIQPSWMWLIKYFMQPATTRVCTCKWGTNVKYNGRFVVGARSLKCPRCPDRVVNPSWNQYSSTGIKKTEKGRPDKAISAICMQFGICSSNDCHRAPREACNNARNVAVPESE